MGEVGGLVMGPVHMVTDLVDYGKALVSTGWAISLLVCTNGITTFLTL